MNTLIVRTAIALVALCAAGCVSVPATKYQPPIANTEVLLRQHPKLSVGEFSAVAGIANKSLSIRGSTLTGSGTDGTYSTYVREAAIAELQTASCYAETSPLRLTGVLQRNELHADIKTGSAVVGAEFVVSSGGKVLFKKSLSAEHQWESSFIGAIAIPAAMDNYSTAVQKLLGKLFSDPDFNVAARASE